MRTPLSIVLLSTLFFSAPAFAATAITSLPYTISTPGSYVLAGNLTGAGPYGITISSSHVTLDLQGYTMSGGGANGRGIWVSGVYYNVTIKNGVLRAWSNAAIESGSCNGCRYEDLQLSGNGLGLWGSNSSVVQRVIATNNTGDGMILGTGSTVDSCASSSNGGVGFRLTSTYGALITRSTASYNASYGVSATGTNIVECQISGNAFGIELKDDCLAKGNVIERSTNEGVKVVGKGNRIEANHFVSNSGYGIYGNGTVTNTLVIQNSFSRNAASYSLPAGNTVGPLVTSANITTSNNPHANYQH